MKKVLLILGIIAAIGWTITGCASTTTSNSSTTATQTQTPTPTPAPTPVSTYNDVLNQNPTSARGLCENYFTLVDQGWTDDDIYKQLSDGGAFDNFYGTGHDFFHAMIRWCYNHTS